MLIDASQIPSGAHVHLRSSEGEEGEEGGGKDQFLSVRSLHTAPGTGVCLRGNRDAWESFEWIVHKEVDGGGMVVSLRNAKGGCLSPSRGGGFTFRSWCSAWERFQVEVVTEEADWPRAAVTLRVMQPEARRGEAVQVKGQRGSPRWIVHFAEAPRLNLAPLLTLSGSARFAYTYEDLPTDARSLVDLLVWAHKDTGFFLAYGHGVDVGVLEALKAETAKEPESRLPISYTGGDDSKHKTNTGLVEERRHKRKSSPHLERGVRPLELKERVQTYMTEVTRLAEDLLLLFAFGEARGKGGREGKSSESKSSIESVKWVQDFMGPSRVLGLRFLVYPPGPMEDEEGRKVVTTHRHTDATFITLLVEDQVGGLQAKARGDRWYEVRSASGDIIVNTGNVLEERSEGFYPAVCHRVIRQNEDRTRVSMPFFYDFAGSKTKGC
uniref:Fe2OG dioxygenase domain-containing protein n=1 Tax=Chromera velia CCMP2878 TaxID=1169474 RepID=A0A0G4FIG0_9ALVE|eukprot:Cvel_17184.t1-p1 / transcript=Cvel_17184.t1 / gene=Cvel_17184 / organism=Chromera_velia_CCMP2878 / gene_product=Feruloyl CoA ortho-hydroxylase 2, putative / transcript_product=Feruloyl CoA ortho-hydroxylase 2, putative / location=Cvel_scaffold1357:43988-45298(+) / protein_length=437 / sequence_SO=supercontig / SO=protein_coding / is_pseudo=false